MDILIYIAKSAAILTLFYMVYIMVLRKDTFFSANRHYLISGIVASLLLPLLIFTKTIYKDAPIANTLVLFDNSSVINPISESNSFTLSWWTIAAIIYVLGIIVMSSRFLKQLRSLFRIIGKQPYTSKNGYRYIKVADDISPFSFFKYIVYNPEKHTENEIKMILKHEQSHASQLHSIDIILTNLLLIVQWMNPFAWLYKKSIEENLEFIADSETVQQIPSKKEYQLSMLKEITITQLQPVLVNNFYQSLIKKRIIMLHKKQSSAKNQWKLLLILPFLGFFLWSFNVEEIIKYNDIYTPETTFDILEENTSLKEDIIIPEVIEEKKNHVSPKAIQPISKKINNNNKIESKITVTIDKNTKDAELEKLKTLFKNNYDVTLKFSGIKRNSAGEIIKIKVSMKSEKSNANFNQGNNDGIGEFKISYDDDSGSISIGNNNPHNTHISSSDNNHYRYETKEDEHGNVSTWVSKDGKHKTKKGKYEYIIHENGDNNNVIHIKSDSNKHANVWVTKDEKHKNKNSHVIIDSESDDENSIFYHDSNSDEDSLFIHKSDDHGFFFVDNDGKDPLVFIDGKKSSKDAIKKLEPNAIKSIEILKGDQAIEKYGKAAKDGVLFISTKNN